MAQFYSYKTLHCNVTLVLYGHHHYLILLASTPQILGQADNLAPSNFMTQLQTKLMHNLHFCPVLLVITFFEETWERVLFHFM